MATAYGLPFIIIITIIIIIIIVINILFLAYHSLSITLALLCHLYVIVASMHVVLPPTHSFPSIHPFSGDVQTKQSPYFYLPPTRVIIYINLIVVAVVVVVALLHSFNSSFITKSIYNTRWGALSVLVLGYSALFSSAYSLFVSDYSSEIYLHLGGYRSLVLTSEECDIAIVLLQATVQDTDHVAGVERTLRGHGHLLAIVVQHELAVLQVPALDGGRQLDLACG